MHGHSSHEAQRLTGDQHKVRLLKNPADASHTQTQTRMQKHTFTHTFPQASPRAMWNKLFASKSGNKHTLPQSRYSGVVSPWNMWRKRKLIHSLTVTVSYTSENNGALRTKRTLENQRETVFSEDTLQGHMLWTIACPFVMVCGPSKLDCPKSGKILNRLSIRELNWLQKTGI